MAWTFSDEANGSAYGTGGVSSQAASVSNGDLIVVLVGLAENDKYCDGLSDTAGNSYTIRSAVFDQAPICNVVVGYCIGATGHASNVVTATFSNSDPAWQYIMVAVFTPDSGEAVSLDVAMNKGSGWEASPWETGSNDTTGDDELCVAVFFNGNERAYSNQEIPGGTAATVLTSPNSIFTGFYRILSATASGLYAETDSDGSGRYACEMVCFKSVAGGAPTEAAFSITGNFGLSVLAGATAEGAMSLAHSLGIAVSAEAVAQAAMSVAAQYGTAFAGNAQAEAAFTLAKALAITAGADAQAEAAFTIAALLALAFSVGEEFVDFSLSHHFGISASGQAQAEAALTFAYEAAIGMQGVANAAAGLSLALQAGISASAQISAEAAMNLAHSLGLSSSAQAVAEGSLTLNQILGLAVVAQALAEAGISIDSVQSITLTATGVLMGITTPDERTLTVSAEVRTITVEGESRTMTVEAEDRTVRVLH